MDDKLVKLKDLDVVKEYVDDSFAGPGAVKANKAPQYTDDGNIAIGDAKYGYEAVKKSYVDDNCVRKLTDESTNIQVYGKEKDGTPTMLNAVQYYSDDRNGIARYINGNLIVNTPSQDGHAATKKYTDDNFVAKFDGSKETGDYRFTVYGQNLGTPENRPISTTPKEGALAIYGSGATLSTGLVRNAKDCTNKEYVDNKFNGANKAVSFINYSSMISSFNALNNTSYNVGQNVMIITLEVPDLWVSEITEESVAYTYVSDDDFVNELTANGSVQVGYYKLSALETQKVDLTDYATLSQVNSKVQKVPYSKTQTFADGSDGGAIGRLYMRFRDNTENSIVADCQSNKYTVPVRDAWGNFYVNDPTQALHAVNKRTVSAMAGTEAPTENTVATYVGQFYYDTTNNDTYQCTAIDTTNKKYTWVKLIRETDYAGNSVKGVVDVRAAFGMMTDQWGRIQTVKATDDEIKAKTNEYHPLVSKNVDLITKTGLTTNELEWTEEEKTSARTLINAVGKDEYAVDNEQAGIVKTIGTTYGVRTSTNGLLFIDCASQPQILDKGTAFKPITPNNLDYAVKVGMTTNQETWTDEEKASARDLLGSASTEVASSIYNNTTGKYVGTAGLFMYDGGGKGGLFKSTTGGDGADRFRIKKATHSDIDNRTPSDYHDAGVGTANHCCPITPANLDYAVVAALTTNTITLTDDQKAAIKSWLGL